MNRRRSLGLKLGFSLVELMLVVGIASILSMMTVSKVRSFAVKAKRSEAQLNIKNIMSLQETYLTEKNDYFPGAIMLGTSFTAFGIPYDVAVPLACNTPNELNFNVISCEKTRYLYRTGIGTGLPGKYYGGNAYEVGNALTGANRRVFSGCKGPLFTSHLDDWLFGHDGTQDYFYLRTDPSAYCY